MPERELPPDGDFDLRARAELSLAFPGAEPPDALLRDVPPVWGRRGFQRTVLAALLVAGGVGTVAAIRPPALVRGAIEHEYYERTLRGRFMDAAPLLQRLGLDEHQALPGFAQLMRPCDIDGHLAYHLTTFFDRGGMVTIFAFDQPVALSDGGGWWNSVYWRVIRSRQGRPLLLVAQKEKALGVAQANLQGRPSS